MAVSAAYLGDQGTPFICIMQRLYWLVTLGWVFGYGCSDGDTGRAGAPDASGGSAGQTAHAAGAPGAPSVGPCTVFPPDNPWNLDVSTLPVRADSDALIDSIGRDDHVHPDFGTEWEGAPIGIPFVVVGAESAPLAVEFTAYGDESDPGPYRIPLDAPVEGGPASDGDRHVIAIDGTSCTLYELYRAFPADRTFPADPAWRADSGAVFDLTRNDEHPFSFTSADAAGLPIFPGLARYEEIVLDRDLRHALRFTVSRSRRALIPPARHYAGSGDDENLPPMGLRVRMKQSYDCSTFSEPARIICAGLKRHGLLLADNGSDWYISGAPDPRWDDDALGDLKQITGDAFEVVDTGEPQTY